MIITSETIIRTLLIDHPECREVFNKYGMGACSSHGPEGPEKPVWFFAQNHGVDLDTLIQELTTAVSDAASH